MVKTEVNIIALTKSKTENNNFILVIEDTESKKNLPIVIGSNEAQYIGIVLENIAVKRPLTHDLIHEIFSALGARPDHVLIEAFKEGIFYASIIIKNQEGKEVNIDSRPSDAIAVALKSQVPVYVRKDLFDQAGYSSSIYSEQSDRSSFKEYTLEDLEKLLAKVLAKEDYESAIRIRETIKARKNDL